MFLIEEMPVLTLNNTNTVTISPKQYDGTLTIDPTTINPGTLSFIPPVPPPGSVLTIAGYTALLSNPYVGLQTATVTVTFSDPSYTAAAFSVSTSVTAASLTASGITVPDRVYNGTNSATASGTVALAGVFSGDAVSATASASFNDVTGTVGGNKTVTINYSLGSAAAGNYSLAPGATTATITTASLTASEVTANNKVFDTTITATTTGTPTLTGVVSGETVTAAVSSANFNTPDIENNKPVTVAFTLNGPTSSNYTLANITLYADITAVPSPSQAQQYLVSSTTDTSASGVTSCVGTTSMRQSKAQGTFKPATSQDWIRYKKGLCSR